MKITFNIKNQKDGGGDLATIIAAIGDLLPDSSKKKIGLPSGFVTYYVDEDVVTEVCSFFGVDYWSTIEGVCVLCSNAEDAEVLKYGASYSVIEDIPVRVRAVSSVKDSKLPSEWPNVFYEDNSDSENPTQEKYTFDEWAGSNIGYANDGNAHLLFPIINRFSGYSRPDGKFFQIINQWTKDNPELDVSLLMAKEYVLITNDANKQYQHT